jgi:bile acid:Na+ symporter, BASS family
MKPTENRTAIILRFIHRHFIWMIISSYIVAAIMPGFGLWIRNVSFGGAGILQNNLVLSLPLLMLAALLFNAGLGVKTEELTRLLQKPFLLLGGVSGNLMIPVAFIVAVSFLMHIWHDPEEVQQILVGLALVASMPIAGASTAWSQNANGSLALSLGLVLSTTALSPLLTPFVLHMAGFVTTGDYSEDLHELASGEVASFLGIWVILPTLLGILVHMLAGELLVTRIKPYLKIINYCILLLLNYSNASLTLPNVVSQPDMDFLAVTLTIVMALCISAFSSGYLLARFSQASNSETVSLIFGLGMNNNGTGLVLASVVLTDHPQVMLPIIFYNLVQHLVASIVDLALFKSRSPKPPLPASV